MKRNCPFLLCILLAVIYILHDPALAREALAQTSGQTQYRVNENGKAVYQGEFEFVPFPSEWELLSHADGNDTVIIFYRKDPGSELSRTIIAYNEEPYGYSTQLEKRSQEFMSRFLWDAIMQQQILERKKTRALSGEGLDLIIEAKDKIDRKKVRAEVVFAKRGERVVAFNITQWRTLDEPFDLSAFDEFSRFVDTFKTLKKSFYENL
jgi:hypothetical protein